MRIGQRAPDFVLPDDTGKPRRLSELRGQTVVLSFYPQDFTPGCQAQLRSLRDEMGRIGNRSVRVFGVSVDSVESHHRFVAAERLTFPLLSDESRSMLPHYDALAENGRAKRKTVIVGPDGRIVGIDDDVQSQFFKSVQSLRSNHGANLRLFLSDWRAEPGMQVPNFWVPDADGKTVSPLRSGTRGTVILFTLPNRPLSAEAVEKVGQLAGLSANSDVSFFGLSTAPAPGAPFPTGVDSSGSVRRHLRPTHAPYVWVLNGLGVVEYRGPLGLRVGQGKLSEDLLRQALARLHGGPPLPATDVAGWGDLP